MKIFYDKKLIKVFIFTLSLIIFLLMFFHDYITEYMREDKNYIKYNKSIYNYYGGNCHINFIGEKHKVGKTFIMFWTQDLYCLDSDIEENIIFTNMDGEGHLQYIWTKEGYEFPNEKTIIDSIQIFDKNEYINSGVRKYIKLDIKNCSINDICVEEKDAEYYEISEYPVVYAKILYNDCIEYYIHIYQEYDKKIYINLYDPNGKDRLFKVKDEYIDKIAVAPFE